MLGLGLYTSQVTCSCFHQFYASFLSFNLVSSNMFIHADLLAFLNIFLLFEMDCCGKLVGDPLIFLSFLGSLFSPGSFPMGLFQADMWRVPSLLIWSPELWSCVLPSNPFTILNSPIMVTAAKAAFWLHSPRVFPFFVRVLLFFSVSWNGKLTPMFSKILLHCVCPKWVEVSPKSSRTMNIKLLQALSRKLD